MFRARTESRVIPFLAFDLDAFTRSPDAVAMLERRDGELFERHDGRDHPGYWTPAADADGSYHVVHTKSGERITITVPTKPCACKVANGLNRAYGYTLAPCYDESGSDDCHGTGKVWRDDASS